jgi:hypothetical protein
MYRKIAGSDHDETRALKASLEEMKARIQAQSAGNRELLSARMAAVRAEIGALKNNPFATSARSGAQAPVFLDLRG